MLYSVEDPIQKASELLSRGEVVGIPTETVYGLAARVDNLSAIEKIFQLKKRPFFDPLIVHVASVEMAKIYCETWTEILDVLAKSFWPGALSLVLPKSDRVPGLVTSGLPTVAIRIPMAKATLAIIERCGVGLAAPSANLFGHTSPTSWQHVVDEFGTDLFVVRDDPSAVGIESTVLSVSIMGKASGTGSAGDLRSSWELSILRPGVITKSEIDKCLKEAKLNYVWSASEGKDPQGRDSILSSPGQVKHHYMPAIPLVIVGPDDSMSEIDRRVVKNWKNFGDPTQGKLNIVSNHSVDFAFEGGDRSYPNLPGVDAQIYVELVLSRDPVLAARELYARMRDCGSSSKHFMYFRLQDYMVGENWTAILDRLRRAAKFNFESEI